MPVTESPTFGFSDSVDCSFAAAAAAGSAGLYCAPAHPAFRSLEIALTGSTTDDPLPPQGHQCHTAQPIAPMMIKPNSTFPLSSSELGFDAGRGADTGAAT